MIRMILADDEVVITKGIQKLIDWNALGIEIVGVYENGRNAFEGIVKMQPELALLDISMPDMTGVEILQKCANLQLSTKVIFMSGFQDFEYAKNAITYGALDYLLKPVIRDELLGAVARGIRTFTGEEQEKNPEKESAEAFSQLSDLEETTYIPILAQILYTGEMSKQMKKLIAFSFDSFLDEYLQQHSIGITFHRNGNTVIVLKGIEEVECMVIVEDIWRKSQETISQKTAFVVGEMVTSMSRIPEMFERCEEQKHYFFFADQMQQPVIQLSVPVFERKVEEERLDKAREALIATMIGQDREAFERNFAQLGKLICWMADGKKEDACFYFCAAARAVEERKTALGIKGKSNEIGNLLGAGRSCESYEELLNVYHEIFLDFMDGVQKTAVGNDKKTFLRAKEYIEKNYNENISLNTMADEVHMNPYYFSTFFKKNAGENFKDYLNKIRLEQAVKLLVSTDKKAYEIAIEVGFSDARSFAEVFQRYYHETPNTYRKRLSEDR